MDSMHLNLVKMYPSLVVNDDLTEYDGFLEIKGMSCRIRLKVPNYPSLHKLTLECSWDISHILEEHTALINEWTCQESVISFLDNLKQFLEEKEIFLSNCNEEGISAQSFKMLAADLEHIGFQNVVKISSLLTEVTLRKVDDFNRNHIIVIAIGNNYPHHPPEIQADLPESNLQEIVKHTVLENIYKSFVENLTSLQPLWNALDILDSFCCVLDPENPTRKDVGRRILLESNVSMYINMNLDDLYAVPNLTFLGPEQLVQAYQANVAVNSESWNPDNNFLDNLKLLLGVTTLPSKRQFSEEALVQEGDCCICFNLRLEDKLPAEVCDNAQCASVYHTSCLFEWLESTVESYESFQRVYGICPNCNMAISCPIPT